MKKNPEFRIVPIIACLLTMLCVGIVYLWGVFQKPVIDYFSWSDSSVKMIYSAMVFMFAFGIFIGGIINDRIGPKPVVMAAGILFFLGLMLTSLLSSNLPESRSWLIYITYGVIAGTGVGFAYSGGINCVQKWLPHRRGFATGLCVCAFGLSIVIFPPVAEFLLKTGVPFTFRMFAIVLGAIVFLMSFFIKTPPPGYASKLGVKEIKESDAYSLLEAVRDPRFWFMCTGLFFLTATYFIINPIVKTLAVFRDVSDSQATITYSLIGVASAASRLILPTLSDKLGRAKSIFAMTIVMMVSSLLMIFAKGALYSIVVFLITFAYSGPSGIYPVMTGEAFGMKNAGAIFGLSFISLGLSSFVFNLLSVIINGDGAVTGDYTLTFIIGAAVNIIPFICLFIYDKVGKKKDAQRASSRSAA
ncbi:MAG: MFS transporter [Oscillospiraceae bacterium]|nr:MFS transporter [Oscillospiraceae bacterium]